VGGAAWTTDTSLNLGQTFRVQLTSAPVVDATVRTATVSIGVPGAVGQSVLTALFAVTVADRTPDAISFASLSDVEPGALVESATATIAGLGVASPFSVSGGEASVDGGGYAASGTVSNGQTVRLRLTADAHGQSRTATLVQSVWVRPSGFLDSAAVSVSGGEVLLESDTVWRTSATLEPGQRFRVRLTSGAAGQTVSAMVSVGGVQATFSVTSGS
jgi:hypothetical protein